MSNTDIYITLRRNRDILNAFEYKTIKGQIKAGDVDGAMKGLKRLIEMRRGKENKI